MKVLLNIFVIFVIFSSALYLWILTWITSTIWVINADFIPYIPTEIRLWLYLALLWVIVALAKWFIN